MINLSRGPKKKSKNRMLFVLQLLLGVSLIALVCIPRVAQANGGPGPGVYALMAMIPPVTGEAGMDVETPTGPKSSVLAWLGGGAAVLMLMIDEEIQYLAPELSLENRVYFRENRYGGGFISPYISAGYFLEHELILAAVGCKVGFKTVDDGPVSFEVYTGVQFPMYYEFDNQVRDRFYVTPYPILTVGLRFSIKLVRPGIKPA